MIILGQMKINYIDLLFQMSGSISAFARYSRESPSSPPEVNSVLPASRKRKRVSIANTNGHSPENQTKKNRSKSLQPSVPIAQTNGQSHLAEQPSTNKKQKNVEKKFLSPVYPTPHPQRRVLVSAPRLSLMDKPTVEESDEDENDEDDVRIFFSSKV
jgi:hypothetical protein